MDLVLMNSQPLIHELPVHFTAIAPADFSAVRLMNLELVIELLEFTK